MKLSEQLNDKVIKFFNDNKVVMDWSEGLTKDHIMKILEDGNYDDLKNEILECSLDWVCESERYLMNQCIDEFKDELMTEFGSEYLGENEVFIDDEINTFMDNNYREYIEIDYNIKRLLSLTGNIPAMIKMHSNYDCCNSFDDIKDDGYLKDVFRRVKKGVSKDDYINEFYNGAYGGSLFCFVFSASIDEIIELKKAVKEGKSIVVPENTQFGFYSDFQGSASCFEKTTNKSITLKSKDDPSKYDCIDIIADCENGGYSLSNIFGQDDWIESQEILIKNG